jgi:hypothetical protein
LGITRTDLAFTRAWNAAWNRDDVDKTVLLRTSAVAAAAGIIADIRKNGMDFGHPSHQDDLAAIESYAIKRGFITDPTKVAFLDEALADAERLLFTTDDGKAWDLVYSALLSRKSLTGVEVEMLLGTGERWPSVGFPP